MAKRSKRGLFVVVLVLGALLAGLERLPGHAATNPVAARGMLDLTGWSPASESPVPLDGEWSFYWGQLLEPGDLASGAPAPTGLLSLPGTWRRFRWGDRGLPTAGYATLQLHITTPDVSELVAVRIPAVFSAYRLWANGSLIAQTGTVGTSAATSLPEYQPQIAVFEPGGRSVDLVLQISNFHGNLAGLVRSIHFGTFEQIVAAKGRTLRLWSSVIGALTLLGLQNLFLFYRRRYQEIHLVAGCFMLFGALLAANEHELVFTRMGPGFGWELHWKMAYVAGFLLIMLATRLIRLLYPQEARTHVDAAALVIAGAGVLLALLTPARIFILVQPAFYLISALTVLYCIETGMRAAKRNLPHAWMVVVSGMAVTIWLESEWRHYYGTPGPKNTATGFVAALAATFGMAVMHLFDHTRLSKTATSLVGENNALNARLSEQVAELQAARELLSAQEEEMHRKTAEFLQSRVQSKLLVVGHHLDEARKWLQTAPEKGRRELETAQSQIEDIRENDVRLVSHLLHPTVISLGLGTAVRSLASEFSQQLHVVIDMKPEVAALDSVAGSSIPERVRLAAYRVLAETLGNARAHAQATAVRIRLSLTPTGDLAIEVADDGIGFDPGSITTGLGLRTMAARLAECDGSLACDSRPGKGTCIRVRIPLPEPEAASKD